MKEELVTLKTAKLAKEKGFYSGTHGIWDWENDESAEPYEIVSQSLLQKWLRETKDIHAEVLSHKYKTKELQAVPRSYQSIVDGDYFESFDSHYEAVENSLMRGLKKL